MFVILHYRFLFQLSTWWPGSSLAQCCRARHFGDLWLGSFLTSRQGESDLGRGYEELTINPSAVLERLQVCPLFKFTNQSLLSQANLETTSFVHEGYEGNMRCFKQQPFLVLCCLTTCCLTFGCSCNYRDL